MAYPNLRYGLGWASLLLLFAAPGYPRTLWRYEEWVLLTCIVAFCGLLIASESTFMRYALPLGVPLAALMARPLFALAQQSAPIMQLVKASPEETESLAGSEDPGNQMDYSPVEGLLHKYEMGLRYVGSTCSAHWRFCYREELIARSSFTLVLRTQAPASWAKATYSVCTAECRANQPP